MLVSPLMSIEIKDGIVASLVDVVLPSTLVAFEPFITTSFMSPYNTQMSLFPCFTSFVKFLPGN